MPPAFHPFSFEHGIALLVGLIGMAAFLMAGKRGGHPRLAATGLLAFFNLAAYPLNQLAWRHIPDAGLENLLPLHLCDIAAILAGFALLFRRRLLAELTYFWGLAGTLQGLLTPAIEVGFPSLPFITFFLQHFAIVTAALFLPIVDGWKLDTPWWKSPLRAFLWVNLYLLASIVINPLLGTNFGFSLHKPTNPSLLDHLGSWPWYLLSLEGVALLFFLLLTLPLLPPRRAK